MFLLPFAHASGVEVKLLGLVSYQAAGLDKAEHDAGGIKEQDHDVGDAVKGHAMRLDERQVDGARQLRKQREQEKGGQLSRGEGIKTG